MTHRVPSLDPVASLTGAERWALFLDIDGTLLELAPHPDRVVVPAELPGRLRRLSRAVGGALALVSGRPLGGIDRLFPRELDAVGTHGAEWRLGGRMYGLARADGGVERAGYAVGEERGGQRQTQREAQGQVRLPGAAGEGERGGGGDSGGEDPIKAAVGPLAMTRLPLAGPARDLLARLERLPGVWLEAKPQGLALHYRQAPDQGVVTRDLMETVLRALGPAYRLQAGKEVLEILPVQASKGAGIRRLMACPPYRGRTPVFVGDDLTDEDGFGAVNALGGISIRVGTGDGTQARYRLATPAALRDWLERLEIHLASASSPASADPGGAECAAACLS